jgi:hypothetical protein
MVREDYIRYKNMYEWGGGDKNESKNEKSMGMRERKKNEDRIEYKRE